MFYKNNKEHIVTTDDFDRYVYSDVGRDVKVNINPEEDDEGFSIVDYGWMRKMVSHSVQVFKMNIPWEDTNIVDTTKNVVPIRGTTNKLVVKHATIDIPKLKNICRDNKEVGNCLNYLCKMLLHKDGKINSFLYTLWNDCMKQKQFCVEKYTYDEITNAVTSVTFRFVATKWNDSWEFNKSSDSDYEFPRKQRKVVMGCDRPARITVNSGEISSEDYAKEQEEIMEVVGPVIFGKSEEQKEKENLPVKHDVTIISKSSENSEETEKLKTKRKVTKKPIEISADDDTCSIADLANNKLG